MAANSLVYKAALQKNIQMGTTIAAIQFADRYAVIANAGDSRVYRLRDEQLELLSTDHTPAAEAFARGEMTWEEAQISPLRNRITRAIGVAEFAVPQLRVVDHKPGDCYLLCSDGLTAHVSDSEILQEMASCCDPHQCVDHLMKRTLCGGATDNTTIISIFA
jgi:protein phosphatase